MPIDTARFVHNDGQIYIVVRLFLPILLNHATLPAAVTAAQDQRHQVASHKMADV